MASRDEDSRGARTLTDDSKGEGYIFERRSSRILAGLKLLKEKKRDYRSRRAFVSRIPLCTGQDGVQAQYRIFCPLTL